MSEKGWFLMQSVTYKPYGAYEYGVWVFDLYYVGQVRKAGNGLWFTDGGVIGYKTRKAAVAAGYAEKIWACQEQESERAHQRRKGVQ